MKNYYSKYSNNESDLLEMSFLMSYFFFFFDIKIKNSAKYQLYKKNYSNLLKIHTFC